MEKRKKMNLTVSIIIFIVVILLLVFITINKKKNAPIQMPTDAQAQVGGVGQNTNMPDTNTQNTKQIDGVKITVLKEGNGEVAKSGDTVAMNYTGKLTNGTVFDSNVDPKFQHVEPFVFTIGAGQVIKGWDVGIAGMKVGEKRELEIIPSFAYGASGAGGVIPPNATLNFEVELLAIKK